jgi:hypothetical protein
MWMTQDGHRLVLARAGVDEVAARLAGGGCGRCLDAARRRIVGTVSRLVPGATLAAPAGADAGRATFVAARGGRRYGIVTRPVAPRTHVITAVRREPLERETAMVTIARPNTIHVVWGGPLAPEALVSGRRAEHAGVYVVYRDGKLLYVGQAKRQSIASRWRGRLAELRHLGLSLPPGDQVYTGRITASTALAGVISRPSGRALDAIDLVEVLLIRQFLGGEGATKWLGARGSHPLTNVQWAKPARPRVTMEGGVTLTITHAGAKPPSLPSAETKIVVPVGGRATFEMPPPV